MMKRLLDALASRRMSVALMTFIVVASLVSVVLPQRSRLTIAEFQSWRAGRPVLSSIAETLQVDRVFSSWWFTVGLAVFTLSILVATIRMVRQAHHRYSEPTRNPSTLVEGVTQEELIDRARALGYRAAPSGTVLRLSRHRLGWWGPALMHLGMLVVLAAAFVSAMFGSTIVIDLSAGEISQPGGPYLYEEAGVLGDPASFNSVVRFEGVETAYWPSGEIRAFKAQVTIVEADGTETPYSITSNDPLEVGGHVLYVDPGNYGDAAFVKFSGEDVPIEYLRIDFPARHEDVVYSSITLDGWPLLEARWDPDLVRGEKSLAIREDGTDGEPWRVDANEGEIAQSGPFKVEFIQSGQWAQFIIVRPVAVNVIFVGFAIIGLGSVMIYVWVPRELTVAENADGVRYSWRAARMPRAYIDELDTILGREGDTE